MVHYSFLATSQSSYQLEAPSTPLLNFPFKPETKSRLSKSFSLHLCGITCNNFYILHHDYSKGMLSSGVDGDPGRTQALAAEARVARRGS